MEERIQIPAGPLSLEGRLVQKAGGKGVVVTHPHPLYGGDMHNHVVQALVEAYDRAGFSTLRFNFRGVGVSGGEYDNGEGECEDLRHAVLALEQSGSSIIHLAGYSFGAWVNAAALKGLSVVQGVVLVSPPVEFMDFSFLQYDPRIRLVVTGERDDIAGASPVALRVSQWNPEAAFHVIKGADHFYQGYTNLLRAVVEEHLTREPKRNVQERSNGN